MPKTDPLLVEILVEELPPGLLGNIVSQFAHGLADRLKARRFAGKGFGPPQIFATLRRLACRLDGVSPVSAESRASVRGPSVEAALDSEGRPTKALEGFARSVGASIDALGRIDHKGREHFSFMRADPPVELEAVLAGLVEESLKTIEAPRLMHWDDSGRLFVRPVRGAVLLHGKRHLPGQVMGVEAGDSTRGHRLLADKPVRLDDAEQYEETLRKEGHVEADFELRREMIRSGLRRFEKLFGAAFLQPKGDSGCAADREIRTNESLVDENAAMVELPHVLAGELSDRHKALPRELLAAGIQGQQKIFVAFGADGNPAGNYAVVSGVPDSGNVVQGNGRVIAARLADAEFFLERDRRTPLEEFDRLLANTSHHHKLGSLADRAGRIRKLAHALSPRLAADKKIVEAAAVHALRDLATRTVGEFPELQGRIIRHLLPTDERDGAVGENLSSYLARVYTPPHQRLPGDGSMSREAMCLALAHYGELLYGMFLAGEEPSGSRDPFSLRRCALGINRLAIEEKCEFSLYSLFSEASLAFGESGTNSSVAGKCCDFVRDRARHYPGLFEIDGVRSGWLANAVLGGDVDVLCWLPEKAAALARFASDPAAPSIVEANKRIKNIFRKSNRDIGKAEADPSLCRQPEEKELVRLLEAHDSRRKRHSTDGDISGKMAEIAKFAKPLDDFFAKVLVNDPDESLRENRFRLLAAIGERLRRVADFSCIELEEASE